MSVVDRPALRGVQTRLRGPAGVLATVMGLPLVDGVFPALVLSGALATTGGILEVGLLVFGGSATVVVVLLELDGSPAQRARTVAVVGSGVIAIAALEAAFAPTVASVLDQAAIERVAAVAIALIGARTASDRVAEWLPHPGLVVAVGLLVSLDPAGFALGTVANGPFLAGVAAASIGVGFALLVALAGPWIRRHVDLLRFRLGSAVALGLLAGSVAGVVQPGLSLVAFGATIAFSIAQGGRERPAPTDRSEHLPGD
ncbi:MAG: DUF5794 domain-containing protein [Halococcoides sp.]